MFEMSPQAPQAGEVLTPSSEDAPSLTPQQICRFASEFKTQTSSRHYSVWRTCINMIAGWNTAQRIGSLATSEQAGLAQFMRARDINVSLIQPLYRNVISRLSVQQPMAICVPVSAETEDIEGARAGNKCFQYHWKQARLSRKITDALEWLALLGTTGLHTHMASNEVAEEAISPDRLRAEPGVGDPDDSRFLGFTILTTRDALKKQFADVPDADKAIDSAKSPDSAFQVTGSAQNYTSPPDRIEVLQAYCRSGHWYTIVGDGTVLAEGKTPGNCMPLQIIRYTKIPGQFMGMGMVEPCLDVQYAFSTTLNQIFRNIRLMSNPKWFIDRQAKLEPDALTSKEAEKVYFSNGLRPQQWAPAPIPDYVHQMIPMMQSYAHDVTGVHSVSTGRRANGISSGRAIEALTSNDLSQLQCTQDEIVWAIEKMGRCDLLYMKDNYGEDKYIREFSPTDGRAMFTVVQATSIAKDPEIFIEADSLFVSMAKDKEQKTLDLLRLGLIDAKRAKQLLPSRLDPLEPIADIADMQHAKRMLAAVIEQGYYLQNQDGTPVIDPTTGKLKPRVRMFQSDNFEMFSLVVDNFMQSDDFRELPDDCQDDVDAFYGDILAQKTLAEMSPEEKAAAQLNSNGNPKGTGMPGVPPEAPGSGPEPMPGDPDMMAANDKAVETAGSEGAV